MKDKHTPGPWKVNHEGTFENNPDHLRHEFSIITPLCDHDNEIGQNTAKLIEAAPELLIRLEELYFYYCEKFTEEDQYLTRKLINKAKGL